MLALFISLIIFFLLGLILSFLKNRTEKVIQFLSVLVFHSVKPGIYLYFLLFLPGIILHELSHLFFSMLLGVPVGTLKLIPQQIDKEKFQLGQVTTAESSPIKEGLIGLAPLMMGLAAILFIIKFGFNFPLENKSYVLTNFIDDLQRFLTLKPIILFISGYGIFTFSNTMFLSDSDRRSWMLLPILLGIILGFLYFIGIISEQFLNFWILKIVSHLNIAFIFSIIIDIIFFLPLGFLYYLLSKGK